MDMMDLIKKRRSIRCFKPEEPPRKTILECLEAATWAPNPTTQQPWKFIVLTKDRLRRVIEVIEEHYAEAFQKKEEHSFPPHPEEMVQPLQKRKERAFQQMISFLKGKGLDLQEVGKGNFNFHRAPVGIIFATYPWKDQNFLKATIAAMENFLLAATARGLGTCWMNAVSICQDYIKKALHLPEYLILVDGVAVGFPEEDHPLNQIPRERLPLEEVVDWPQ